VASLALTAFWGMVTVGRVLFAAIEKVSRSGETIACCLWYRRLPCPSVLLKFGHREDNKENK